MAEIVVRSGHKAVELVNDLLALAEAGQRPSRTEEVAVNEVVARILEERAAAISQRRVQVRVDPELGRVKAAPAHLYQLFANLIGNALRHNQSPEPVLEVRRLPTTDQACHRYLVRDNGKGIPAAELPHIFQPFFKGRSGGHGIGLSTVHKIVTLYGGDICAFNDGGACFQLTVRDWPSA
jgi:signal transduction histidine kinase